MMYIILSDIVIYHMICIPSRHVRWSPASPAVGSPRSRFALMLDEALVSGSMCGHSALRDVQRMETQCAYFCSVCRVQAAHSAPGGSLNQLHSPAICARTWCAPRGAVVCSRQNVVCRMSTSVKCHLVPLSVVCSCNKCCLLSLSVLLPLLSVYFCLFPPNVVCSCQNVICRMSTYVKCCLIPLSWGDWMSRVPASLLGDLGIRRSQVGSSLEPTGSTQTKDFKIDTCHFLA